MICLSETFLRGNQEIVIDGYKWYGNNRVACHPRAKRGSGGVGALIKNDILQMFNVSILDNTEEDMLWLKLTSKVSEFVLCLCICYLPPKGSSRGSEGDMFFTTLTNQVYAYQNEGLVCVCGDVNARCGENTDFIEGVDCVPPRTIVDNVENEYGDLFVDHMTTTSMCMLNGRVGESDCNCFTSISKKGKAVVDYAWVPHEQLSQWANFKVNTVSGLIESLGLSVPDTQPDHSVLQWELMLPHNVHVQSDNVIQEKTERYIVKDIPDSFFNDEYTQFVVERTITRIEQSIHVQNDIDTAYEHFVNMVTTEMDKKLPIKTVAANVARNKKSLFKPYWNDELQALWDARVTAEREWLRCKETTNKKRQLKAKYCDQRRLFDRLKRQCKRKYQLEQQTQLCNDFNNADKNTFWRELGKIGMYKNRKVKIPWEVVDENGETSCDKDVVLNRWCNDFKTLYVDNETDVMYDQEHLDDIKQQLETGNVHSDRNVDGNELNGCITLKEVEQAVGRAKRRKAVGIDELPAEVLKSKSCVLVLHKIVSHAFELGIVPDQWKKAIISPIPKSGSADNRDPLNYRGISLISVPCKIYCDILNKRLSLWLESNNLLNEAQNGFRKDRSCLDHLYTLCSIIKNRKASGESTFVCYVDMKKAFDNVNRLCMWYKLQKLGVHGKFLGAIQSLYQDMKCTVKVNGVLSSWFGVGKGVRQGCLLSPTLFATYVDDLALEINALGLGVDVDGLLISILMFADDIALIGESEIQLQSMLNILHSWTKKWRLSVHTGKTKVVHYRPRTKPCSTYQFLCGEEPLDYVDKYKYLGFWLQEYLDMKCSVKALAASASRALGMLMGKYFDAGGMSHQVFEALYKSLVAPVMLYGSAIWGVKEYGCVNTVQNRACRFYLGVGSHASNDATRGDMGWSLPLHQQYCEVVRFWCRLQNVCETRLCAKVHQWSLHLKKRYSWEKSVQAILCKSDLEGIENPRCRLNVKHVISMLQENLSFIDQGMWHYSLWDDRKNENGNKLRLYRCYKSQLKTEQYVQQVIPRYQRRILSRLRTGCLPLAVETGRYLRPKIPLENRVCTFCEQHCVEDETHFLIDCDLYADQRFELFQIVADKYPDFSEYPSLGKFCTLMNEESIQTKLASTVHAMFARRKRFI